MSGIFSNREMPGHECISDSQARYGTISLYIGKFRDTCNSLKILNLRTFQESDRKFVAFTEIFLDECIADVI